MINKIQFRFEISGNFNYWWARKKSMCFEWTSKHFEGIIFHVYFHYPYHYDQRIQSNIKNSNTHWMKKNIDTALENMRKTDTLPEPNNIMRTVFICTGSKHLENWIGAFPFFLFASFAIAIRHSTSDWWTLARHLSSTVTQSQDFMGKLIAEWECGPVAVSLERILQSHFHVQFPIFLSFRTLAWFVVLCAPTLSTQLIEFLNIWATFLLLNSIKLNLMTLTRFFLLCCNLQKSVTFESDTLTRLNRSSLTVLIMEFLIYLLWTCLRQGNNNDCNCKWE